MNTLDEIGKATRQYLRDFSQCVKEDGCVDEFVPCAKLKYDSKICEGCKVEPICQLMHKIA